MVQYARKGMRNVDAVVMTVKHLVSSMQQQAMTYRNDPGSCTHRANIQHENLPFAELLHLALLLPTLHHQ